VTAEPSTASGAEDPEIDEPHTDSRDMETPLGLSSPPRDGAIVAISDLHVEHPENRSFVDRLRPDRADDWLIVAGDVGDLMSDIEWGLRTLAARFDRVIWVPGNHDLWTRPDDPVQLRGEERYRRLVDYCRGIGVVTPEDPYPLWNGHGGPLRIAPLFTLYDYSFGARDRDAALARGRAAGVVCSDEYVLFTDPHPTVAEWCAERVRLSAGRLAASGDVPTVLVSHFPLIREPTRVLRYPVFAQWCGTELTGDWHTRFDAVAVVYGHLHIPRSTVHDGVRFEEVSLGYPREWRPRSATPPPPRRIAGAADVELVATRGTG
jgi:3',5'-cyclic AMP phosphodiesterase CpdA